MSERRSEDLPCAPLTPGGSDSPTAHHGHDQGHGAGEHGHTHGVEPGADLRYLGVALGLIAAFMLAEVIAALFSGSLALFADAGHMLTDVAALAASMWAARLATRPALGSWTYGLKRAEILSAAVNGVSLAVIGAVIAVEAVRRLIAPPQVTGGVVLGVALAGALVNVVATWVLARANRASLNVRGAFAHILTDLYAFLGTALAGLVIVLTGWVRADAIASLLVAGLMGHAAWGLLRDAGRILLQGAPEGVSLEDVRTHLAQCDHVIDVHDLHAWTVTSGLPVLTAHVTLQDHCFTDGHAPRVLDTLQTCLVGHFDVEHSTFQLETASHVDHEHATHP